MNPDWMALARAGQGHHVRMALAAADVVPAGIPQKLWSVIAATPGWFKVV